jgi:branched-chain amino acid transport system substrate-binding protein
LHGDEQSSETIKIGVLADLDGFYGKSIWQGTMLAAEQINAEGGIMGKKIKVIGEDTDVESGSDATKINLALTRLITFRNVDIIIGMAVNQGIMIQETIAQHKKIFFDMDTTEVAYSQRVLDDYDRYKYYFRITFNATSMFQGTSAPFFQFKELTGLNKIGILADDVGWTKGITEGLDVVLPELGYDIVYKGEFPPHDTIDFSGYFAAAEQAGVEILIPLIAFQAIPFVKEYHDRQSPMVIYGGYLGGVGGSQGWVNTDGKCEYISVSSTAVDASYPLTNKTLPFREAYIGKWNEIPPLNAAQAYTILRYIISDAIKRAGTLEVDAVINALEATSVETPNAKNFVFTKSHDPMVGENPNDPDYDNVKLFQWQNGELVPVYPQKIMEDAGATYLYPPWAGPWDNIN